MNASKILVWDIPTRLFHWLLAASFAGAFLTAESERYRDVHVVLGYTVMGLVAFRVVWGFLGTRYARFSSFAFGPAKVLEYVKSLFTPQPRHYVGHNPAGSWMIWLLIGAAAVAGVTGYATYQELGGEWLGEVHEGAANFMMGLVVVHIAGVVASSLVHRENLARAMVSGRKAGRPGEGIRTRHWIVAAVLVAAVAGFWSNAGLLGGTSGANPEASSHRHHHEHEERG